MNIYRQVIWEQLGENFIKLRYEGSRRRIGRELYREGVLIRSIPEGYRGTVANFAKTVIDELYTRQKAAMIEEIKKMPHMRVRSAV